MVDRSLPADRYQTAERQLRSSRVHRVPINSGFVKGEPQEKLVDRLVREAMEAGEFDDLPGTGKPIAGAGTSDDEYWWFRDWVRRNQIDPDRPQSES